MVMHKIDGISFRLKGDRDLTWVKRYGTVFSAFDATGSGCICFGVTDGKEKLFIKIAGADTVEAEIPPESSVQILKDASELYRILRHPALVDLIEAYPLGDLYVAVFRWAEGECLFDHWNFARYERMPDVCSPKERFRALPVEKKLRAVGSIFSFLENVAAHHYVAVDLYDGSLIYDLETDRLTICDIDLFRKQPAVNDLGEAYWGTKRLKAPEEYVLGAAIDESTNVFTLGALLFDLFGAYTREEIRRRYTESRFLPCKEEGWTLGKDAYKVLLKAVSLDRAERYRTIAGFHRAFCAVTGG